MIAYYGTTISPHQIETGEGFLICKSVPIARVGEQDYLGSEVNQPDKAVVKVYRDADEVFAPSAIASFEGKPFTNDHPPVLLDADNAKDYAVGHVQNVRRGTGEMTGYLLADIHIHDSATISDIQNGKREISCGYECEFVDNGDGTLSQRHIIGNHVALVTEGRAGAGASIMDNKQTKPKERKRTMSKKSVFLNLFGHAASGKSAEEIAQLAMDSAEALEGAEAEDAEPTEEETVPTEETKETTDEDTDYQRKLFESIDGLSAKLDALMTAIAPKEEKEEPKDPVDEALEVIEERLHGEEASGEGDPEIDGEPTEESADEETPAETEEAHVVPAEEMGDCGAMDASTAKSIILAMRESIASIKDDGQRKSVADALLSAVGAKKTASDSAKIAKATQRNASARQTASLDLDAVQSAYDKLNPHKNKEV